jgi:hypothetical protein
MRWWRILPRKYHWLFVRLDEPSVETRAAVEAVARELSPAPLFVDPPFSIMPPCLARGRACGQHRGG